MFSESKPYLLGLRRIEAEARFCNIPRENIHNLAQFLAEIYGTTRETVWHDVVEYEDRVKKDSKAKHYHILQDKRYERNPKLTAPVCPICGAAWTEYEIRKGIHFHPAKK